MYIPNLALHKYTVEILKESGLLDVKYVVGTYPYTFYNITLTPRGRYEFQRQSIGRQFSSGEEIPKADKKMTLRPYPAGSPFGFTDIDWEIVIKKRNVTRKLYVVLGYKFQSTYMKYRFHDLYIENLTRNHMHLPY
jgi:hypothetical protein